MKKLNVIFVCLLTALMSTALVGCNKNKKNTSTEEVHEHTLGSYQHDEHDHWQVCSSCGEIIGKESHRGGSSTCVQKAICEVCGAEYGTFDDHTFGAWQFNAGEDYHYHECSVCHEIEQEPHVFNRHAISPTYLVGAYDDSCTGSNEYYLSCVCGAFIEDPTKTFVVDNHHSFTEEIILPYDANLISAASCTEAAEYGKVCAHCHTAFSVEETFFDGDPIGHAFELHDEELSFATYHCAYAYCTNCSEYFIDVREPGALEPVYQNVSQDLIFDDTKGQYGQDGYGTLEHPYIIGNERDLFAFRDAVNGGDTFSGQYFVMSNDITLALDKEFGDCIGRDDNHPFSGTFDGNNKTITNFKKTKVADGVTDAKDAVGLFSRVTNGTIKNLSLANVTTYVSGQRASGVVARAHNATLNNVHVLSGTITGLKENGGLIGTVVNAVSTITNCSNHANVTGTSTTATNYANGGLIGYIHSGGVSISNSINYGAVECGATGAGGILGMQAAGNVTISNCENRGNVHCTKEGVGGILGYVKVTAAATTTISNCTNYAQVKGDSGNGYGGIFGSSTDATSYLTLSISDCVNRGNVLGMAHIGGIAGLPRVMKSGSIIQDCQNYGNVTGSSASGYVGGVVSRARIIIQNCACYSEAQLKNNGTITVAKNANSNGKGAASTPGFILTVIDSAGSLVGGKLINADGSDYSA